MNEKEIADSLSRAFDRIDDFRAVQEGSSLEELREAVLLLQQAVGVEDESRRLIRDRLQELNGFQHGGEVLLGVIVGLLAAELEGEITSIQRG
jgi:soluble cytochrome b562